MYKICKSDQSCKRQKLFQSTFLSMLHEQKYQSISVISLCREMQIPRKTFYRYFDTLEDVLYSIIDETLTQNFLYLEVTPDLAGFFSQWKNQKYLMEALQKSGLCHLLLDRIHEWIGENKQLEGLTNEDLRNIASVSAIMTIVVTWYLSGMKQSVEEMCELTKGILNFDTV